MPSPLAYQPWRYFRLKKSFADATFVTRIFSPSYSIFFPARNATTPSNMTSVSLEAYSNGLDACVLPLQAFTQFISCSSLGIRGNFCAGLPYESCSDFGSSRGFNP